MNKQEGPEEQNIVRPGHWATTGRWFCISSGLILGITGMAKVWSAFGRAAILTRLDPIIGISFGHLMVAGGIIELAVAALCLLSRSKIIAPIVVAWLASVFLTYRMGLWWIGWHRPCPCLGNLTDMLRISPHAADNFMKVVLAYLFVASYGSLIWVWWHREKAQASRPAG